MKVAIIGTGDIAERYAVNARYFNNYDVTACTNRSEEKGRIFAKRHGLEFKSETEILNDPEIGAIFNLTPPAAHAEVSLRALEAGKHVFGEKPLATNLEDAMKIGALAKVNGLRVGFAPDTVLGALIQSAKSQIDEGIYGKIHSAISRFQSAGMESWHPNPAFFFQKGGGPVLDIGPYHLATLVFLLGSVESVTAVSKTVRNEREIGSGALKGQRFPVDIPTTTHAILKFENGAIVTVIASFDVVGHERYDLHFYGETGSFRLSDPNWFNGEILEMQNGRSVAPSQDYPSAKINDQEFANYRGLGMAEMIDSIQKNRPHRCSFEFAYHVLEVLLKIEHSALSQKPVEIISRSSDMNPMTAEEQLTLFV